MTLWSRGSIYSIQFYELYRLHNVAFVYLKYRRLHKVAFVYCRFYGAVSYTIRIYTGSICSIQIYGGSIKTFVYVYIYMGGFNFFVIFMLHRFFSRNYEYFLMFFIQFLYKNTINSQKLSFFTKMFSNKCTG